MQKPESGKVSFHNMTTTNGDGVVIVFRAARDNPVQEQQAVLDSMQSQLTQTAGRTDTDAVLEYMRSKSDIDLNDQQTDESEL